MRQLFLPPNNAKSVFLSGTASAFSGTTGITVTLPDGIWQEAVVLICGNSLNNSYRGVMVQCSTDSTKTQSFEVGSGAAGTYNNFYSKMAGSSILSGTNCWSQNLQTVYIDGTTRPNTLKMIWSAGTVGYAYYSITAYR